MKLKKYFYLKRKFRKKILFCPLIQKIKWNNNKNILYKTKKSLLL